MENQNTNQSNQGQQVNQSGQFNGNYGAISSEYGNQQNNGPMNTNAQQNNSNYTGNSDGSNSQYSQNIQNQQGDMGNQSYGNNQRSDQQFNDPEYNTRYGSQINNRSVEEKANNEQGQIATNNIRDIVAVHWEEGNLAAFKLDDGTVLSKEEAIALTKQGGIRDVNVGRRGSRELLRRNPVEDASKALRNMPTF